MPGHQQGGGDHGHPSGQMMKQGRRHCQVRRLKEKTESGLHLVLVHFQRSCLRAGGIGAVHLERLGGSNGSDAE